MALGPETSSTMNSRVIVVGGGMVGIATALWTQRAGKVVTLIDKGVSEDRASFGNAGVLASSSVLPVTMPGIIRKLPKMVLSSKEPIYLRWAYLPRILPWALKYLSNANDTDVRRIADALHHIIGNSLDDHHALTDGTQAKRHIKECNFSVLYESRSSFLKDSCTWETRRRNGWKWREYEDDDLKAHDPIFQDSLNFLASLPRHGQILDPGAYMDDLRNHFEASGGTLIKGEVSDILHSDGRVSGVMTEAGPIEAQAVAITAGAWSPLLTKKLGVHIPVEAESGYHMEFWEPSITPQSPTLVPSKKLIFSPMNGRLRVAGFVEFGGLNNKGQEKVFDFLKQSVKDVLPDLTYAKETRWFGHRPAPTDSLPVIDELPNINGVFLGFGHQHVGLTGSARTGQILAQLVSGSRPNIDLSPYRLSRFSDSNYVLQSHSEAKLNLEGV